MGTRYRLLHNVDPRASWAGYSVGDLLDEVAVGELDDDAGRMLFDEGLLRPKVVVEWIVATENAKVAEGSSPLRITTRGDVVEVDGQAYALQNSGWWRVNLDDAPRMREPGDIE